MTFNSVAIALVFQFLTTTPAIALGVYLGIRLGLKGAQPKTT